MPMKKTLVLENQISPETFRQVFRCRADFPFNCRVEPPTHAISTGDEYIEVAEYAVEGDLKVIKMRRLFCLCHGAEFEVATRQHGQK